MRQIYGDPEPLDLSNLTPFGWVYDGVFHLLPGVTLEEAQGGMWEFTGQIVDSEGRVLKEAEGIDADG